MKLLETELVSALVAGDPKRVRAALDRGANPNHRGPFPFLGSDPEDYFRCPAIVAATLLSGGSTGILHELLEHGANPNVRTDGRQTALHWASFDGHVGQVSLLLAYRASASMRDANGYTALHVAVHRNQTGAAAALLRAGANPNTRLDTGWTPLHTLSCVQGHRGDGTGLTLLLLAHGANGDGIDARRWTPLHCAAYFGNPQVARVLLEHGVDIEARERNGWTALHHAAATGGTDTLTLLLAHRADPNAVDAHANTPLHLAAANGSPERVRLLLAAHADPHRTNNSGKTPLETTVGVRHGRGGTAAIALLAALDKVDYVVMFRLLRYTVRRMTQVYGGRELVEALLDRGVSPVSLSRQDYLASLEDNDRCNRRAGNFGLRPEVAATLRLLGRNGGKLPPEATAQLL